MIDFFVPIVPVGKARPVVCRNGHSFTPEKTRNAEQEIRAFFLEKYPNFTPYDGAVDMQIMLLMPRPEARKKDLHYLQKPDIDNAAKLVADALNGYAYIDDKQIVLLSVTKSYKGDLGTFGIRVVCLQLCSLKQNKINIKKE